MHVDRWLNTGETEIREISKRTQRHNKRPLSKLLINTDNNEK